MTSRTPWKTLERLKTSGFAYNNKEEEEEDIYYREMTCKSLLTEEVKRKNEEETEWKRKYTLLRSAMTNKILHRLWNDGRSEFVRKRWWLLQDIPTNCCYEDTYWNDSFTVFLRRLWVLLDQWSITNAVLLFKCPFTAMIYSSCLYCFGCIVTRLNGNLCMYI